MKKKIVFPSYSIIAFAFSLILFIFLIVAHVLENNNIFFYTGSPTYTTSDLFDLVLVVSSILFVSAVIVFLRKNIQKKFPKILIGTIIVIINCVCLFYDFALSLLQPQSYTEIVSDNGEHSIVIGEDCYIFSPYGGDVFEKTSFCTMKKIGRYDAGIDYYKPFSDGKYYVVWNEKDFELHYDFDGTGNKYKSITVKYLGE